MKVNLNISHINRLFNLTEKHMDWFRQNYPNSLPKYSSLLRRNHRIIIHYCVLDLQNRYDDSDIHIKLDRMFKAYDGLQEISLMNKGITPFNRKEVH